jgi:hypothetical protein
MVYQCEECGYSTNKKDHYERHINRKTTCRDKIKLKFNLQNVYGDLQNVYGDLQNVYGDLQNVYAPIICSKCNNEFSSMYTLRRHSINCKGVSSPLECQKCGKTFSSRAGKSQHLKHVRCVDDIPNIIDNSVHHNTTINGNVTIQNNYNSNHVHMNVFGQEDFSYLENDTYIVHKFNSFSKDSVYGATNMIMSLLFDPERPENHTIIKTTERGSGVMIRGVDSQWHYREFEDVLDVFNSTAEAFVSFYEKYRKHNNIKLVEQKEFRRVRSFAKVLRKLGCTLDDAFEKELGIYDESESDDSSDEEKKLERMNKKFEKATLTNIFTNTKIMYKYRKGKVIKK